eukprot:CAMPEP_0119483386 /NCGR_PEP_ID=MMETSP1344-20130328/10819_1 /TAXON_ID=236787 /ORGANISM="Florenciella parvula, Strain CCMP2471" /LENGTH=45 /DNA_ID= /DNA_START= /DNA_END= /DNA_ORIENTATION=
MTSSETPPADGLGYTQRTTPEHDGALHWRHAGCNPASLTTAAATA